MEEKHLVYFHTKTRGHKKRTKYLVYIVSKSNGHGKVLCSLETGQLSRKGKQGLLCLKD